MARTTDRRGEPTDEYLDELSDWWEKYQMSSNARKVTVCGVPYEMSIVDGAVLFSNKSGFYGYSSRTIWQFREHLWYLVSSEDTWGKIPGCHLTKMHWLLGEHIGEDHEEFELKFKPEKPFVFPPFPRPVQAGEFCE